MEIRLLRYFAAVAETRSFTRAAETLGVSQPTLSHQIRKLESDLGTLLFERGARHVTLTSAGATFKPFCDRTLKELDSGVLAIADLKGLVRGTLRMAVFHSFANSGLGPVFAQFALLHPGVKIEARLLSRVDMERGLLAGDLDFAIAYICDDAEHIVAEKLFDEELVLVVGSRRTIPGNRLAMRRIVDFPLVLLTPEFGARQYLERFFASRRLTPKVAIEMNAVDPILALVRDSDLATVVSQGAVDASTPGVHVVRLFDPAPRRGLAILWRRGGYRSAAALRLAEMIHARYGRGRATARTRGKAARRHAAAAHESPASA
jgi:LysR family transcriptional regulator, cyn operon transcriptional activator